jgi:hypothetical protein
MKDMHKMLFIHFMHILHNAANAASASIYLAGKKAFHREKVK